MADQCFPQLSAGAVVQYPFRKVRKYRAIRNVLPDGRLIQLPDPGARQVQWELTYNNLTFDDVEALRSHYRVCKGPLQSFTFLDPMANLLAFSESLRATVWQSSSQFAIAEINGSPRPDLRAYSVTNTSQADATLFQRIAAPSFYTFCFSLYLRSEEPANVGLVQTAITAKSSAERECTTHWSRVCLSASLTERSSALSAGLTLAPGQRVYVSSPQLEAQYAMSEYKPTWSRSGVYLNARYGMPEIVVSVESPNIYSTTIVVEAAE